jgi:hypothetical protein
LFLLLFTFHPLAFRRLLDFARVCVPFFALHTPRSLFSPGKRAPPQRFALRLPRPSWRDISACCRESCTPERLNLRLVFFELLSDSDDPPATFLAAPELVCGLCLSAKAPPIAAGKAANKGARAVGVPIRIGLWSELADLCLNGANSIHSASQLRFFH